jgi:hypothetical protein
MQVTNARRRNLQIGVVITKHIAENACASALCSVGAARALLWSVIATQQAEGRTGMSRKRIVAATMTAAALGLGFVGYVALANGTEESANRPSGSSETSGSNTGYRANHQQAHGGAVFAWMDAAATWNHSPRHNEGEVTIGQCFMPSSSQDDEAAGSAMASDDTGRANKPAGGSSGASGYETDTWAGGHRYAGGYAGGGGFSGGVGSGGKNNNASGSSDPSSSKPTQDAPAPASSTAEEPGSGSADPKAGDPPQVSQDPPANDNTGNPTNPPTQEQTKDLDKTPDEKPEQKPDVDQTKDEGKGGGTDETTPPWVDTAPKDVHGVPEPATMGMLGFALAAAAALRRRRRN